MMCQKIPVKNILVVIITVLLKFNRGFIDGARQTTLTVNHIFEKYMRAVKKLSADFPNHQIELHLDIAGADVDRPPRRFNYLRLKQPFDIKRGVRSGNSNHTETTKLPTSPLGSTNDPEMRPVYMKDLKNAIEDLEKKYSKQITGSFNIPNVPKDENMKKILQLLEKGTLVSRDEVKPTDENMSWLQIKIPNM